MERWKEDFHPKGKLYQQDIFMAYSRDTEAS